MLECVGSGINLLHYLRDLMVSTETVIFCLLFAISNAALHQKFSA